jgi:hypothetical protein
LVEAVEEGARVSTLLRLIGEGFGPKEFGLESALPDAAEEIVRDTAEDLVDRFAVTLERLYEDNRPIIEALATAGYPLPPELRAPAELALARRLEDQIVAVGDPATSDPEAFRVAQDVVREARALHLQLATPRAAVVMSRAVQTAVDRAVVEPTAGHVDAVLALLALTRDLGVAVDLDGPQEQVFAALALAATGSPLHDLGRALNLRA